MVCAVPRYSPYAGMPRINKGNFHLCRAPSSMTSRVNRLLNRFRWLWRDGAEAWSCSCPLQQNPCKIGKDKNLLLGGHHPVQEFRRVAVSEANHSINDKWKEELRPWHEMQTIFYGLLDITYHKRLLKLVIYLHAFIWSPKIRVRSRKLSSV